MKDLCNYLKIIEREIEYQKRVYHAKTERYRELVRQRNILLIMIMIIEQNKKNVR